MPDLPPPLLVPLIATTNLDLIWPSNSTSTLPGTKTPSPLPPQACLPPCLQGQGLPAQARTPGATSKLHSPALFLSTVPLNLGGTV